MGRNDRIRKAAAGLTALALLLGPVSEAFAETPAAKPAEAATSSPSASNTVYAERKSLFDAMGAALGLPWYHLAAIDQYERTVNSVRKRPTPPGLLAITYSEAEWAGPLNPVPHDTDLRSIALFGGKGTDGDGDGKADLQSDLDRLQTLLGRLLRSGMDKDRFREGLMELYGNEAAADRILEFSRIYATFGTLDLHDHVFPLPLGSDYSYRDTWGDRRGWGGARIHEGTDIFAGYGVPVRSTCYGVIEIMGWNPYGGWRVGIRDLNGIYHYYAHLSGFNKQVKAGDVVKVGQIVGWVGSSGYGKPGTSGKFPPHLHYGMYRDNGKTEWSFDPYSYLRRWEREERSAKYRKK